MPSPLDQPIPPPPNTNNGLLVRGVLLLLAWVLFVCNGGLVLLELVQRPDWDWVGVLGVLLLYSLAVPLLGYLFSQLIKAVLWLGQGLCWLVYWRWGQGLMQRWRAGWQVLWVFLWGQLGVLIILLVKLFRYF